MPLGVAIKCIASLASIRRVDWDVAATPALVAVWYVLKPSFVATPVDDMDCAAVMFISAEPTVAMGTFGCAGVKVTYFSVEPSRQGAEMPHRFTVVEATKSDTELEMVGLSAANVLPTYVHPAGVASITTEDVELNAVNKDVDGLDEVSRRRMSRM